MKKTLCALAIGATIITPVISNAADVKVYGRAHVSAEYLDNGGDFNDVTLSSNASRLGFKAEQKVSDDLTVFAQIEQEINFASGSADSKGVDFATRNTFVGVKGDFGQAKVGRFDSPFKSARGPANFFGDMLGDLRNVTRAGDGRFDERNANTIEYTTPKFADGFNATAALSLNGDPDFQDATTGDAKEDNKAYDLALTYKKDKINFAAAYEHYEDNADSRKERDGFRVSGSYKITPELNLAGLYQYTQTDASDQGKTYNNADAHVFGVAAEYKIAAKTYLRGQVFQRDVDFDDANSTLLAIGVEQRIAPEFRVYANLAGMFNDKNAKLTTWSQAHSNSSVAGVNGEDAFGLAVGMRYDF